MVNTVFRYFVVAMLCGWISLAAQAANKSEMISAVIEGSGVRSMVEAFPGLLKEGVKQGAAEAAVADDAMLRRIEHAIDSQYDAQTTLSIVKQVLTEKLSVTDLQHVIEWLHSPLGKRVKTLETSVSDLKVIKRMESEVPVLRKKYKGTPREKLFTRFDAATAATESSLDTAIAVQLALAGAMASAAPQGAAPSYDELKAMIEGNRFMLRGLIGQQVYDGYLFTYQELSHDELLDYLTFITSEAGQRYTKAMNMAVRDALRKPSEAIGRSIVNG